jgi:hypothetical protein
MKSFVQITISTKILKDALTGLLKLWSSRAKDRVISIKACYEYIEISVPGATKKVKAEVIGEANIILPVKLILAYLQTCSTEIITLKFSPGQLECGSSIFNTTAIELSSINEEAENDEYINISQLSLLRILLKNGNSLIDNRPLLGNLKKARARFKNDLVTASEILEAYGIRYEDLEQFVIKQIKRE